MVRHWSLIPAFAGCGSPYRRVRAHFLVQILPPQRPPGDTLVFKGHLFRKRRGRGYVFTEKPPEPKPVHEPVRRPDRVAQMLAFAHGLGAAIERGDFRDQADGREPMSERDLRTVIYTGDWGAQRAEWRALAAAA